MAELHTAHTAELDAGTLTAARALLYDVRADRRGRGYGAAMMDALETVVRGAYELGALGATDEAAAFYAARGWMLWRGPSSALTPSGIRRTEEDDGCIYVLPMEVPLDLSSGLTCDWRDGDLWRSRPPRRPGPRSIGPTGPVGRNDGTSAQAQGRVLCASRVSVN